jgi:hypothetical protein
MLLEADCYQAAMPGPVKTTAWLSTVLKQPRNQLVTNLHGCAAHLKLVASKVNFTTFSL